VSSASGPYGSFDNPNSYDEETVKKVGKVIVIDDTRARDVHWRQTITTRTRAHGVAVMTKLWRNNQPRETVCTGLVIGTKEKLRVRFSSRDDVTSALRVSFAKRIMKEHADRYCPSSGGSKMTTLVVIFAVVLLPSIVGNIGAQGTLRVVYLQVHTPDY